MYFLSDPQGALSDLAYADARPAGMDIVRERPLSGRIANLHGQGS